MINEHLVSKIFNRDGSFIDGCFAFPIPINLFCQ